jgi:diguanylate cyclase (GGDEF)-like protein
MLASRESRQAASAGLVVSLLLGGAALAVLLGAVGTDATAARLSAPVAVAVAGIAALALWLHARVERALAAAEARALYAARLRDMSSSVAEHEEEMTVLGDTRDVSMLVLRAAIEIVGAEKGLLLSRRDADEDGALDLVCAIGVDHEPGAYVQQFARQVLARDETVRRDDLVALPVYIRDRFEGVIVLANAPGGFGRYDDGVLLSIGDHAGSALRSARLRGEARDAYLATVRMLADAIEAKDRVLRSHSDEVSVYVAAVADALGIGGRRREELVFGSLLHDIGKIGISERILLKPAPLTAEELSAIRLHPRIGARLVEQVPALRPIMPAVLHHHESFDGGGYPTGLRGEEIPLEARIVAVADSFSAMTADRPYRARLSVEEACAELERWAGTQFDPEIVRLFVAEVRRRPPGEREDVLHEALADPELEAKRDGAAALVGGPSFALTDSVTLLYSHRHLHEEAEACAQRAELQGMPFAIVLLDLVDLPEINRREGYGAGDAALERVARAVERLAAERRGTPARYSGRRLALLLPETDEAGAADASRALADRLEDGPAVRTAWVAWSTGESGADVLDRVAALLAPGSKARA